MAIDLTLPCFKHKRPKRCVREEIRYNTNMIYLTKQERLVLYVVLSLLLTGWAVRAYRTAHPPPQAGQEQPGP
jgi:hypothetical protein